MSRLPAQIQWEADTNSYIARYLSASEVLPEWIPAEEEHRLLFCPASMDDSLWMARLPGEDAANVRHHDSHYKMESLYPYCVLVGIGDFKLGQGIELQWKMQQGSPFGWWYGVLEQLDYDADGDTAVATITFRHFPEHSSWRWLRVRFGDGETRPCTMGGWSGGIRPTSVVEEKRWMQFFPASPVLF